MVNLEILNDSKAIKQADNQPRLETDQIASVDN